VWWAVFPTVKHQNTAHHCYDMTVEHQNTTHHTDEGIKCKKNISTNLHTNNECIIV
jgi:hypothetical protein